MLGPKMQMVIQFCQRGLPSTGWQTMRTDLSSPGLSLIEATICRVSEHRIGSSGSRLCHPAGDLTRAKQSRAGNRLWLFKLPISCYSGQRMLRQLLGIVDAMCCTSVSRQLARLCTLTMLLPAQSSQLGPAAACRGFEPHRPVGSWSLDPTEAWTCLPIMKAVAAADRGTGILVTCPVCLQAMCVYTGTRPNTPIAGFLRENLILLLLLRWLAGSGQGVGGSYFYFGGEKSRAVALEG